VCVCVRACVCVWLDMLIFFSFSSGFFLRLTLIILWIHTNMTFLMWWMAVGRRCYMQNTCSVYIVRHNSCVTVCCCLRFSWLHKLNSTLETGKQIELRLLVILACTESSWEFGLVGLATLISMFRVVYWIRQVILPHKHKTLYGVISLLFR
jgi:hypothetical protein